MKARGWGEVVGLVTGVVGAEVQAPGFCHCPLCLNSAEATQMFLWTGVLSCDLDGWATCTPSPVGEHPVLRLRPCASQPGVTGVTGQPGVPFPSPAGVILLLFHERGR